jgi:uncharacterized membrane protein (UPF0127 family)
VAWLVRDDRVLATLELAESRRSRRRGLLGRDGIEGALLLRPARAVHTLGMRFAIDVAYCDADLKVIKVRRMGRHRLGLPVTAARAVLEAEAGAFASWDLRVGDELEVRGAEPGDDPAGATP